MEPAEGNNRKAHLPLTALQRQPASLGRVLVILASVVVVCAEMYVAAGPILTPILFALVLALILSPVHGWLRRRLPTLLALLIMVIGLVALTFGLVILVRTSLSSFTAELSSYSARWDDQLAQLQAWLDRLGLQTVALSSVFDPEAIAAVLGTIAAAILGFLSDLFLILVLVLFFLAEGPAMMLRLQSSVEEGHPRIERLFVVYLFQIGNGFLLCGFQSANGLLYNFATLGSSPSPHTLSPSTLTGAPAGCRTVGVRT